MKKILTLAICFCCPATALTQINYVATIPASNIQHIHLKNGGDKLVHWFSGLDTITFYNYDGSIYKTIAIPPPNVTSTAMYISLITETLFDNDSTDIEYVQQIYNTQSSLTLFHTRIYDEYGNLIFSRDSFLLSGPIVAADYNIPANSFSSIFMIDTTTYMMLVDNTGSIGTKTELYSLPGKLDPVCCSSSGVGVGGTNLINDEQWNFGLTTAPNPSKTFTKVYYDLPEGVSQGTLVFYDFYGKEIKRFEVSDLFNYITVSTDNLPSGTYVCRIITSKGVSEGKKQIVVE